MSKPFTYLYTCRHCSNRKLRISSLTIKLIKQPVLYIFKNTFTNL